MWLVNIYLASKNFPFESCTKRKWQRNRAQMANLPCTKLRTSFRCNGVVFMPQLVNIACTEPLEYFTSCWPKARTRRQITVNPQCIINDAICACIGICSVSNAGALLTGASYLSAQPRLGIVKMISARKLLNCYPDNSNWLTREIAKYTSYAEAVEWAMGARLPICTHPDL